MGTSGAVWRCHKTPSTDVESASIITADHGVLPRSPALRNQFLFDPLLREHLQRTLPPELLQAESGSLSELGELSADRLYRLQLADRLNEPRLLQWNAWGQRVDQIEVTPLWREAARLAARFGVVGGAYEPGPGEHARTLQFAHAYLFHPSTDVYSCPLAMTDGAARTLLELGNQPLIERAVAHLTSRQPEEMWTSGRWMTERTGGSDVGLSETIARRELSEGPEAYRLYGTKWFTSATTAQMADPGPPGGNGPGGRGLALFYVEVRRPDGQYNGIQVNRPERQAGHAQSTDGRADARWRASDAGERPVRWYVRNISTMLNITRTWNAAMSASSMRRALAWCRTTLRDAWPSGARIADKAAASRDAGRHRG